MLSIVKREFIGAFRRLYAYVFVSVLTLASAISFVLCNLGFASTTIATAISYINVAAFLLIPILASNSFSPVKERENADEVYDALPISASGVVLGKYFAALCVFGVSVIPVLLYPVIAGFFAPVDHAQCYAIILAYVLTQAAHLGVCFAITSRTSSKAVSLVCSYAAGFICLGVGVILSFLSIVLHGAIDTLVSAVTLFGRSGVFAYGLFDFGAIVFFIAVTVASLFVACIRYKRRFLAIGNKASRRNSVIAVCCVTVATLIFNVCTALVPLKVSALDMTPNRTNTITAAAKEFLADINKPVTIYILDPSNDAAYERYIDLYASANKNIRVEEVYSEHFYEEKGIVADDVTPNSLYIESDERGLYLNYLNMYVYTNEELGFKGISASDYSYYYSLFSSNQSYYESLYSLLYNTDTYFAGDYMICTYIEYVTADIIPANYYLKGHGERDISTSASPFYSAGLVELTIDGDIPADAAGILINDPAEDISEAERDAFLEYLARGGQITLISDNDLLGMPNFCAVLAAYGLSAENRIVTVEKKPAENNGAQTQTQENAPEGAPEATPETTTTFDPVINYDSDILYVLEEYQIIFSVSDANPIVFDKDHKKSLLATPLLWVDEGEGTDAVGYSVEDTTGAKLVWVTGAQSYNSTQSYAAFVALTACEWVTLEYESNTGNIPPVLQEAAATAITSKGVVFVAALLIIAPLAFGTFGGVIYYRQRKIRKTKV